MAARILVIFTFFLLTGCGLFVEDVILKDNSCSDLQEKKPIDSWNHPEKTIEEHMRQWIACGGDSYGDYEPRENHQLQYICMLDMGYRYTLQCSDSEINWMCHERSLDKFPPHYKWRHSHNFRFRK